MEKQKGVYWRVWLGGSEDVVEKRWSRRKVEKMR